MVFGCTSSRSAWILRRGPFKDDEWSTIIIRDMNEAVFSVRPMWVTNGRRSAVIAMLGSSLRMFQLGLGMDGPCRSTKQGGLSDFVSHTMQFLVSFEVHIIRDRSCQLLSFMTYTEGLQFFALGSSISPQICTASEVHAFLFEIDPDIIPRVTYHIM